MRIPSSKLTFRAFAEITALVLSAVSLIYASRIVGPVYLGFSATTNAIVLLVSRLADGGLTSLTSQRLAREDEELAVLLALTVPSKAIISALLIGLCMAVTLVVPMDARLRYFLSISVFMVFFEVCSPAWVFVALGRINLASVVRVSQSLLYASAIFFLVRGAQDWKWLPFLTVFNSFVSFAMALFFLWRLRLHLPERGSFGNDYWRRVKGVYREGLHFLKADLSAYVYTTSDRLILYYFTNPQVVGYYEAAYKVINPFYSLNAVITPTMFRDLAQSFKHGRLRPVMAKYVFTMSLFSIPLGFFLIYFSPFVVGLLYGSKFAESIPCLKVLGFVITFGFTSGIIVQPFAAWNMSREYGNSILWGNILNTVLNFALIPFIGALGAALATVAAKIVVTVVGYRYFSKATDYPIVKDFAIFTLVSAVPLVVIYLLREAGVGDYGNLAVYALLYLVLIFAAFKAHFKASLAPIEQQ